MSYLIFDTETTGFPSKEKSHDDPAQARVMQLAWLQLDDKLNEIGCFNSLIRISDRLIVSDGAIGAHGITPEHARKYGAPMDEVLCLWNRKMQESELVVCHNTAFDLQLNDIENAVHGYDNPLLKQPSFCTMRTLTPMCQLPHKNGRKSIFGQQYKWPTLQEAHEFCYGERFDDAHDALADIRATARVFRWLVHNGHVPSLSLNTPRPKVAEGTVENSQPNTISHSKHSISPSFVCQSTTTDYPLLVEEGSGKRYADIDGKRVYEDDVKAGKHGKIISVTPIEETAQALQTK